MSFTHEMLFGYYPYLAGTVFLLGSILRYDKEQYSWRAGSSQMLHSKGFRMASNCFHIGILMLFGGHLVGLLTPHSAYTAIGLTTSAKQMIAMTAGGIFGSICFVGLTMLIHRRFTNPRVKATSSTSDNAILILLYVQLILGLISIFLSLEHMDGTVMVQLAEWAQHVVTWRGGAAEYIVDVHWVFKAHLFLGMTMFLVFPFTRLVHVWSAPVWYITRSYQVVRRKNSRVKSTNF